MEERRLLVSFSGGETSALMTKIILDRMSDEYDKIVTVFANTGQENEETLRFVDRCDKEFGFGVVWIEGVTSDTHGVGARFKEVSFATASRDGKPFEDMIRKYGIPGPGRPHCTRELKSRPIARWAVENGWEPRSYDLAIGIRQDEFDRMSPNASLNRIIYPLISRFPHTKQKVNDFWVRQPFRLELKGYQGNCAWCWKKSLRKHLTIITETPDVYDFPDRMESTYPNNGAGRTGEPKRFFRGNRTVKDLREIASSDFTRASDDAREYQPNLIDLIDADLDYCGSETCEVDL